MKTKKLEDALISLGFSKMISRGAYLKFRDIRCNQSLFYFIDYKGNLLEGSNIKTSINVNHRVKSLLEKASKRCTLY